MTRVLGFKRQPPGIIVYTHMIKISPTLAIDEKEIRLEFIRASGPGGQNVNKVATAVQLRFDVNQCAVLSDDQRRRLRQIAGKKMTADGLLVIEAKRYRTQERNRKDALERFVRLLRLATQHTKRRRPTRPTAASKKRRLAAKRQRSALKRRRAAVSSETQ